MQTTYNTNPVQSSSVMLLLCISLFFMVFHVQICTAPFCNPANYTKASKFEKNFNIVVNNLVNHINSSSNGFDTSFSGQSPDTAYGLLQCRGDATVDECYHCSQEANTSIRHECGNAKGGRIMLERCFMRYENYSFVGKLDTQTIVYYNLANATYPDDYTTAVKELFKNLTKEALNGSANRYASGSTTDPSFQKIFGLVQCWRDVTSIDDCTTCLSIAISSLLEVTVMNGAIHVGGVGLLGSCIARYENYPFVNSRPSSSPSILF